MPIFVTVSPTDTAGDEVIFIQIPGRPCRPRQRSRSLPSSRRVPLQVRYEPGGMIPFLSWTTTAIQAGRR